MPAAYLVILMTSNGHAAAHAPHPLQASASCRTDDFTQPNASSESACGWQAATQRPHPVQRTVSMRGRALDASAAAAGLPTLDGLGPVGDGAHADHEWTSVPAMAERAALVAALLTQI